MTTGPPGKLRITKPASRLQAVATFTALAVSWTAFSIPVAAANNDAIAAEFRAICERDRATSDFFGRGFREQVEKQLSAERNTPQDLDLLLQLADDAVRLGEFDRAEDFLSDALVIANKDPQTGRSNVLMLQAMTHFFAAEDANCLAFNNAASCILPIRPEAVHREVEPILKATAAFESFLALEPQDPEARWLLNLSHMLAGSYPDGVPPRHLIAPELILPSSTPPEGVAASHKAMPQMINAGPALGVDVQDLAGGALSDDFDGDGYIDLISSSWDPCSTLRAFRSTGSGGFEDVTQAWGLDSQMGGINLVHADVDNDGALDVLVLRGAWAGKRGQIRSSLLLNRVTQNEGFIDVTYAAGLAHPAYPTQAAAFADYDLDGDLDLYVGNESSISSTDFLSFDAAATRPYPAQLFQNTGLSDDGIPRFTDVARAAGVQNQSFAKGVAWGDIDNDGDQDLFVANIGPNRLYLNLGNGRFEDVASEWGVQDPSRSFVAWFFDYDNDGDLDLFNSDYSASVAMVAASLAGEKVEGGHPRLYRNDGDTMVNVASPTGLGQPLLVMGANFGDLDGDGFEDIVLGTGVPDYTAVHPNVVFRNQEGRTFSNATADSGLGHLQKGHAVAFSDIDDDGDLEMFEQLGGAFPYDSFGNALYLNPINDQRFGAPQGHRFLTLELRGTAANSSAVGARVVVRFTEASGQKRSIHRVVSSGGSFGGSSFKLEMGLGSATKIESVTISWPGQQEPRVLSGDQLELDHSYLIIEGRAPAGGPSTRGRTDGGAKDSGAVDRVQAVALRPFKFKPRSSDANTHHNHDG